MRPPRRRGPSPSLSPHSTASSSADASPAALRSWSSSRPGTWTRKRLIQRRSWRPTGRPSLSCRLCSSKVTGAVSGGSVRTIRSPPLNSGNFCGRGWPWWLPALHSSPPSRVGSHPPMGSDRGTLCSRRVSRSGHARRSTLPQPHPCHGHPGHGRGPGGGVRGHVERGLRAGGPPPSPHGRGPGHGRGGRVNHQVRTSPDVTRASHLGVIA